MTTEHIKMPAVTPIVRYAASGSQTVFSYPFPIFAEADLAVSLNGARQTSGYTVSGEGETGGGSVTFSTAPASGVVVTLAREIPIARVSDFLEGGEFSTRALNTELDTLVAALQQVSRAQETMLRYPDTENPAVVELPGRDQRKDMALGFDSDGNPMLLPHGATQASPSFTATGTGAVSRSLSSKLNESVSVRDFGAVGDGVTDDTNAFINALAARNCVHVPTGTYLITATVSVPVGRALYGLGNKSVIKCQSDTFNALELRAGYATVRNLKIEGGDAAVKLYGYSSECVENHLHDLHIVGPKTGLLLDGYTDTNKPCYWNSFNRILIEQPTVNGVHLVKSGAGDTPNANVFSRVRVYSKGAPTSGHGFYVEQGAHANIFTDCEANVNGPTAQACFRIGAGSNKTLLVNLYTESTNTVPNVRLDAGSEETAIVNLHAQSDGSAIYDFSGGNYDAYNAGYPEKNRLRRSVVTDLKATLARFDTEYIDSTGTVNLDLSHSVHLVSSFGGALTVNLPLASTAPGVMMTIKKIDSSSNIVTVGEQSAGPGPDGRSILLGTRYDFVTVISNGASWFIVASNRIAGNTRYFDGSGTYDIDMTVDTYMLSAFSGALTARLPPANAAKTIGRTITLKKTDVSGNAVTVTEQGGSGPDNSSQTLSSQYKAITVVSNGANWFVVSKY
jgi:hypothetical protein